MVCSSKSEKLSLAFDLIAYESATPGDRRSSSAKHLWLSKHGVWRLFRAILSAVFVLCRGTEQLLEPVLASSTTSLSSVDTGAMAERTTSAMHAQIKLLDSVAMFVANSVHHYTKQCVGHATDQMYFDHIAAWYSGGGNQPVDGTSLGCELISWLELLDIRKWSAMALDGAHQ